MGGAAHADPDNLRYQQALAKAYNDSAGYQARPIRSSNWSAKPWLSRGHGPTRSEDARAHDELGAILNHLGNLLADQRQFREALTLYKRAAEHYRLAYDKAPQIVRYGSALALNDSHAAWMHKNLGEKEAALSWFQASNYIWKRLATENPSIPSLQSAAYWQLLVAELPSARAWQGGGSRGAGASSARRSGAAPLVVHGGRPLPSRLRPVPLRGTTRSPRG